MDTEFKKGLLEICAVKTLMKTDSYSLYLFYKKIKEKKHL